MSLPGNPRKEGDEQESPDYRYPEGDGYRYGKDKAIHELVDSHYSLLGNEIVARYLMDYFRENHLIEKILRSEASIRPSSGVENIS